MLTGDDGGLRNEVAGAVLKKRREARLARVRPVIVVVLALLICLLIAALLR